MAYKNNFDVIIIGGSYAGLSAGMSLGRALRQVLIIDSGKPCNIQTPHSHNFITHDGETPAQVSALAKEQVKKYDTVSFYEGLAVSGIKKESGFEIRTQSGDILTAKKLIFATGIKDIMPDISGFAECWGISVIHCPYCHGYEVKNEKTGLMANGDAGYEYAKTIRNWTKDLTLFTNGKSTLTYEQNEKVREHQIKVVETEIDSIEHQHGRIQNILFKDGSKAPFTAIYSRPQFVQHSDIPPSLGCELTEQGYIQIDAFQKTTVAGVYACGDNTTQARAISLSVSTGSLTGIVVNKELIEEEF
jgi:thioredoxin reductase